MSFLTNKLKKIKSLRIAKATKRQLLKQVEKEARQEGKKLKQFEAKAKQADDFLKEIEKVKKRGAKKGYIGGKAHTIASLKKKGSQAKRIAEKGIKVARQARYIANYTIIELDRLDRSTLPPKKQKLVPKKTWAKKKTTNHIKQKTQIKRIAIPPSRKVNRYLITDIKTGKKGTFNARNSDLAKDKATFVLNSRKKNLRYKQI